MMKKVLNSSLFIFFILLIFAPLHKVVASESSDNVPKIVAKISKDTILIGDQPIITISVTKDVSQKLFFPEFDNEIAKGVELISESEIDTLREDGSRSIELTKEYKITIFEAGAYALAGFPVFLLEGEKIDTLLSNPIELVVKSYAIDTTNESTAIFDIKPPLDAPLLFSEIDEYVYWSLLGLLVIAIAVWLIMRYRKNKTIFSKPKLPPHVIAASELEKVKEMQLWQKGRHKEYYTYLTDIVREYLYGRFSKGAMEMTTEEIMLAIKEDEIPQSDRELLYELLSLADLVKFAKYTPDNYDNENSFKSAVNFVENTKQEVEVTLEEKSDVVDNKREVVKENISKENTPIHDLEQIDNDIKKEE